MRGRILTNLEELDMRLKIIENRFNDMGYSMKRVAQTEFKKRWKVAPQAETLYGFFTALCVDTIDPFKQGRVRFFSPYFHKPGTPVKALPFADHCSAFGGFDDSGSNWIPPAGSMLVIGFEHGNRSSPIYFGTLAHRDRGPDGNHNWGYIIDEYDKIHEGHRKGYLAGPNDGSQVFHPWNIENYNSFDSDSTADIEKDPNFFKKISYPHIYGFKTPQKHYLKMVDGDYKCNQRWKRVELKSSLGNYMIFKDDHLHPAGQWAHPSCCSGSASGSSSGGTNNCVDEEGNPIEQTECDSNRNSNTCTNQYYKREDECRMIKGPGTPQNNKVDLPQYGLQFGSVGGAVFGMDDSVEEPRGKPEWEKGTQNFDYGCTDLFKGKTFWISSTGHRIEMSDIESDSKVRGDKNYIRIISAAGNKIELNDHSISSAAGEHRGIVFESTSKHRLELNDNENDQASPERKEGGVPTNKAKKAFIKMRSGYGLELHMWDGDQQTTNDQFIQLTAPQRVSATSGNIERGPHIFRMQERSSGPGQVWLRAGGHYVCMTYDAHYTVVGDAEKNPSDKITIVSRHTVQESKGFCYNVAETHAMRANNAILLLAGNDCESQDAETGEITCTPCIWPVVVVTSQGLAISDRVFASASQECSYVNIAQIIGNSATKGVNCKQTPTLNQEQAQQLQQQIDNVVGNAANQVPFPQAT